MTAQFTPSPHTLQPTREGTHPDTQRSLNAFPGASNGEFNLPADLACVIRSGSGSRIVTTRGQEMLDFSMGWGSVLPGHAQPQIVAAVAAAAVSGTNFAYVNANSLALAEELLRVQPNLNRRMRFCASGTEATMYCLRLARAFTRKNAVLKFEGAYHGANDEGVTSLFPSGTRPFPLPEPSSAGIQSHNTLIAPFNDLDTAAALIRQHAKDLACVIVEPFHRCLSPRPGFLAGLREVCDSCGVLLVFDEVVTGFRLAYGGAQQRYGVTADLVAYGKALGGGLPIGAFVGRRDIMDLVREDQLGQSQYVWTASTLGGNPVSCAGALAALALYRQPDTYPMLEKLGDYFREGLRRALKDTGTTGQVIGDGPLGQIVFTDQPVLEYRDVARGDGRRSRAMMLGLFDTGVFVNPMGTKLYLSLAHTVDDCDEFVARLQNVLRDTSRPATP